MRVDDLVRMLKVYPGHATVTVSLSPGRRLEISGHTAFMEHDSGELCQPCEVTLLAGEVWQGLDLDEVVAEAEGQAA